MAIVKTEGKESGIIELTINNGDLQAFKEVMEQYGFINEEALLRYALVALLRSDDNTLYIKKDGNTLALKVSPGLIKQQEAKAKEENS